MSVPDEPAHTIKAAAVARGQFLGNTTGTQGERLTVTVPGYIAALGDGVCFAARNAVTADCAPTIDATDRGPKEAATSAGNYNPFYYAVVGLGSRGLSGETALYAMRLISTWLSAFFLATVFAAAVSLRRHVLPLLAAAVVLTPAVLFLSAGINPNSLEIATAASLFMCLCSVLERSRRLETVRPQVWAVSVAGVFLANTRPVSLLWLAVTVAAAVLAYRWSALVRVLRYRANLLPIGVLALGCVFALFWLVTANSFESLLPGEPIPRGVAAVTMLDRTFEYVQEYVGIQGWLDTPPPVAVTYTWVTAAAVILLAGATARPVRGRWSVALLAAVLFLAPIALQAASSETVGWIWQGRYILAVLVVLLLACGIAARFVPFRWTQRTKSRLIWSLAAGVAAHVYFLLEGLRRYTVGLDGNRVNWTEMFTPQWQPPMTWQFLTLVYLAGLAVAAWCLYLLISNGTRPLRVAKVHEQPSREVQQTAP